LVNYAFNNKTQIKPPIHMKSNFIPLFLLFLITSLYLELTACSSKQAPSPITASGQHPTNDVKKVPKQQGPQLGKDQL